MNKKQKKEKFIEMLLLSLYGFEIRPLKIRIVNDRVKVYTMENFLIASWKANSNYLKGD